MVLGTKMRRARLDLVIAAARTISALTVRCSSTTSVIRNAATSLALSPHQCVSKTVEDWSDG